MDYLDSDGPSEDEFEMECTNMGHDWRTPAPYRVEPNTSTIYIKVYCIFLQRENVLSDQTRGNFNPDYDSSELEDAIEDIQKNVNYRLANLRPPSADKGCPDNGFQCYEAPSITDPKIQFVFENVYDVRDDYLYDIMDNSGNMNACPGGWHPDFKVHADNLEQNRGFTDGITVYFGNDISDYEDHLITKIEPEPDFVTVCCSMHPTLNVSNSDLQSRVTMNNMFLRFRYDLEGLCANCSYTHDYDQLVYSYSRGLLHELGHSLNLNHHPSQTCDECNENVMFKPNDESVKPVMNYMKPFQIDIMLRALHITSVRKYAICNEPINKSWEPEAKRYIKTDQTWGFNTRLYTDLIIEEGAELTICGTVYMPPNGRIIVKRGARLIVDGGIISLNRNDSQCDDLYWKGIYVFGNSSRDQVDDPYGPLQHDDAGVVLITNGAEISNARTAISTKFTHDHDPGYGSWFFHMYGGLVVAENSTFKNNKRSAEFMSYPRQNKSRFTNCTFTSTDPVTNRGVTLWETNGVLFENNTFSGMGEACIGMVDAAPWIKQGNTFTNSEVGVLIASTMDYGNTIQIGQLQGRTNNFNLTGNTVGGIGIQSYEVDQINIENNVFEVGNTAFEINGESEYDFRYNQLLGGVNGIYNYQGRSVFPMNATCNYYQDIARSIYVLGGNESLYFDNETFENSESADVRLTQVGNGDVGAIFPVLGNLDEPATSIFSLGKRQRIVSPTDGTTQTFTYFYPSGNSRAIPTCELSNTDPDCQGDENNFVVVNSGVLRVLSCPQQSTDPDPPCKLPPCYALKKTAYLNALNNYDPNNSASFVLHKKSQLAVHSALRSVAAHLDQEVSMASAIAFLNSEEDLIYLAQKVKLSILLRNQGWTEAGQLLSELPTALEDESIYKALQTINLDVRSDSTYVLDSQQLSDLYAYSISESSHSALAKSLLIWLNGNMFYHEEGLEERSSKSAVSSQDEVLVLTIAPNPTNGLLVVSLPETGKDKTIAATIYDVSGRALLSRTFQTHQFTMDFSEFKDGLYFLHCHDGENIWTSRFLKN